MSILVLIDSNAIIGNGYKIQTNNLEDFFYENELVIAEPTLKEIIKNYNKNQEEKEKSLEAAIRAANKFGIGINWKIVNKQDFEHKFNTELDQLNALILENDEANINFIFNKSLLLKKPFKVNSKNKEVGGFRDVLIWSLWLDYLEINHTRFDQIVIVNSDNDFIDGDKLQEDLLEDLSERNIPTDKIRIKKNIKTLTEFVIQYQEYQQSLESIPEEDIEDIQSEIIEKSISEGLDEAIAKIVEEYYPIEYEPQVKHIERDNSIHVDTMSGERDDLYLYFTEDFIMKIEYFIPKTDYIVNQLKNIEVLDYDWNDWVMHVEENFTFQVGFEVSLDMVDREIFEMNYYVDDNLTPFYDGDINDDYEDYKKTLIKQ